MRHRLSVAIVLVSLLLASAGTTDAAAQEPEPSTPDTTVDAAAADTSESAPEPFQISGFATVSYAYSSDDVDRAIVGRLYDRFHDQFTLNAAKVVVEKAAATDRIDAGARIDLLFGQNAAVIQSAGLSLGSQGDLEQAFATLNVPTGAETYVQFKAGKMVTLMGVEVIEDVVNPNLSVANQFVYVENFTMTGVGIDVKLGPQLDGQFRVINGWDVVADNNSGKSFMARLGITPDDRSTIAFLGYAGPEQADNTGNTRYGGEVVASRKLGARASVLGQFDYGREEFDAATAKWLGVGVWLTYDLSPEVGLALRGDYIDDKDGARTSGVLGFPANTGHSFGSGTATLNIKKWTNALVRPELRYDRSSLASFNGAKDQFTVALGLSYLF